MIVDIFAGPGGWDQGARMLGRADTIGLEWDRAACDTAMAAGHARVQCDVTTAEPAQFVGATGLIGSPSCTLFSAAGNGVGNLVTDILATGITRMLRGEDCRSEIREAIYPTTLAMREAANAKRKPEKQWTQERVEAQAQDDTFVACLVLEPARWLVALSVEWVALEQVPEVLPLWQVYARELKSLGYSTWTGVLNSADYGVPQTRRRAILMAHRSMSVSPPAPTHAENPAAGADLFGGEPLPWVSMATALGWGFDDEPSCTVTSGGTETGGAEPFGNAGYRKRLSDFMGSKPAPTLTTTRRSKDGMLVGRQLSSGEGENIGGKNWIRLGTQDGANGRPITEPAPTVLFGHASNDVRWHETQPLSRAERESAKQDWAYDRPATTVVGSFEPDVISPPGYRTSVSRQNAEGGVRVTVAEGGVLQSFPADYPWQGSRTKQYQQVGNAIPPVLAMHILAALAVAQ